MNCNFCEKLKNQKFRKKNLFFFVTSPIFFLTFRTAVVHTATDALLVFVVGRLWGVAGSADTGWFRSSSGGGEGDF